MTFSCPHYDIDKDKCWRLKTECVPGRPGCVMRNNSRFAVPAEQRMAEAREETRRKGQARQHEACGHPECPLGEKGEAKAATPAKQKKTASRVAVTQTKKVAKKPTRQQKTQQTTQKKRKKKSTKATATKKP